LTTRPTCRVYPRLIKPTLIGSVLLPGVKVRAEHGRAVHVEPTKPWLKAPETERLKLKYGVQLYNFAFKFNLRRCNMVNKSMSIDLAERGIVLALLHPGWVRTRMTAGSGYIDADESAAGLIRTMEGRAEPNRET
jgi:hypothetical protein